MSSKKKNILNAVFLLVVFFLTIYSVFGGEDLSDIADTMTEASPVFLILGVACVVFYGLSRPSSIIFLERCR